MIYPNTKKLEVEIKDLAYVVIRVGGGDLEAALVSKEIWDSWSDQEDAMQFVDNIPNGLKLEFTNPHKLINFCVEHGLKIRSSTVEALY